MPPTKQQRSFPEDRSLPFKKPFSATSNYSTGASLFRRLFRFFAHPPSTRRSRQKSSPLNNTTSKSNSNGAGTKIFPFMRHLTDYQGRQGGIKKAGTKGWDSPRNKERVNASSLDSHEELEGVSTYRNYSLQQIVQNNSYPSTTSSLEGCDNHNLALELRHTKRPPLYIHNDRSFPCLDLSSAKLDHTTVPTFEVNNQGELLISIGPCASGGFGAVMILAQRTKSCSKGGDGIKEWAFKISKGREENRPYGRRTSVERHPL